MVGGRIELGYTRKWLDAADKNRQPFDEDLFSTILSVENVTKILSELKTETSNKIAENQRVIDDDFVYFLQVTSQRTPHIPLHLLRM